MEVKKIYLEDLRIANAIIGRDGSITRQFFYKQSYPLFKSIYDNYHTDCDSCKEFIDEIYLLLLSPSKQTGKCQMENYKGESTLTTWLKSACLYYCYAKYSKKETMLRYDPISNNDNDEGDFSDRNENIYGSIELDFGNLNREDALAILKRMPNKRYSEIIRLRYLELLTHEDTAKTLGMTMDNYYNKHKLAKAQYIRVHRKEGLL